MIKIESKNRWAVVAYWQFKDLKHRDIWPANEIKDFGIGHEKNSMFERSEFWIFRLVDLYHLWQIKDLKQGDIWPTYDSSFALVGLGHYSYIQWGRVEGEV